MEMRRRTFLVASIPPLVGLPGCVGDASSPGTSPEPGAGDTPTGTTEPPKTDLAPAPDPATDVFADMACPSFDDAADRTVCYHRVDPSTEDVVLGVGKEVFDPYLRDDDVETLRFTLYNRSDWHFHFNPDGWGIERFDDGRWVHVAPEAHNVPLALLPPGETYVWEIPSQLHPTPFDEWYTVLDVALPAGVYAFHVAGSFGGSLGTGRTPTDTPTAEPPDERVECVGLFRLDDDVDPGSSGGTPRETEIGTVVDE